MGETKTREAQLIHPCLPELTYPQQTDDGGAVVSKMDYKRKYGLV